MSHAARMIAEAQARREQAVAEGDEAEVRRCETQIARWEQVRDDVDQAPPLSPAVRDKLSVLLRPAPAEPVISHQRRRAEPRNAKAA